MNIIVKLVIAVFLLVNAFFCSGNLAPAQARVSEDDLVVGEVTLTATAGTPTGIFTTLKEAFDAINAGTHQDGIAITINADTTETATSNLTFSGDGMASYTSITITPLPGGPRVVSGMMANGDPLINLNGADNVVINGINSGGTSLTLANTSTTNFGISSTIRYENGATFNTIRNVNVLGSTTGTNTATILFYNDTITPDGSDNNIIEFCNIGPNGGNLPGNAIRATSVNTTPDISNSNNSVRNNNIYDFTVNGIFLFPGRFWTITDNRFYQTTPRTGAHRVLHLDGPNPNDTEGLTVTGNIIGYSSAAGTGVYTVTNASRFDAIYIRIRFAGTTSNISNNTITAICLSNTAGSSFFGIFAQQGPLNVNGNLIGSMTATDSITVSSNTLSSTESAGIVHFGGVVNFAANNNQIGGLTFTNANVGALIFRGIYAGSVATDPFTATGNTIGGTVVNSIQTSGFAATSQTVGIGSNWNSNISGNTIQNLTVRDGEGTAAAASVIGVSTTNASVNHTVARNTIRDLTNTRTFNSGVVTGIQFTGSTQNTVERNHISRLFNSTPGTASEVNGIRVAGGTTVYRNNMIAVGDGITRSLGSAPTTGGISGINEPTGTNNFYHNSVYIGGVPTLGTGSSFALNSSVTTNVRNHRSNIFSNARTNSGATGTNYAVRVGGTGLNPAGLTINNNLYFVSGTGSVFGFYASADVADLTAWQANIGQDAASLFSNPNFTNATFPAPNLHLHPTIPSPARNAGIGVGVANDFDGDARPLGMAIDIGADEVPEVTAAAVSIGGRVVTANGSGVNRAIVTLTDQSGNVRRVVTGSFGYYRFDDVAAGQTCVLSVGNKRYQFAEPIRVVTVADDALEIDFVALQ